MKVHDINHQIIEKNGLNFLELLSPDNKPFKSFKFIVTSRQGGISPYPYNSLNLSYRVGDDKKNVDFNRKKLFQSINCEEKNFFYSGQIHGDGIVCVKEGGVNYLPQADALITNEKNIFLSILVADCLPIMIFDPHRKVFGIAHCGWRGTILYLAQKTVGKMQELFSVKPSNCKAILGPSICSNCYEIREDLIEKVKDSFRDNEIGIKWKDGKIFLDLVEINVELLKLIGLKEENIYLTNLCTFENSALFFSHRRDNGKTGRMMVVGWMEK